MPYTKYWKREAIKLRAHLVLLKGSLELIEKELGKKIVPISRIKKRITRLSNSIMKTQDKRVFCDEESIKNHSR